MNKNCTLSKYDLDDILDYCSCKYKDIDSDLGFIKAAYKSKIPLQKICKVVALKEFIIKNFDKILKEILD